MPNADYRNRNHIYATDRRLGEALDDVLAAANRIAAQTNANPQGSTPAPPQISSLNVTAADGVFDIAIGDNNPVSRGINYFVEYSDSTQFTTPTVIDLGASRNERRLLGALTLYFRAYSQYPTSPGSPSVYFGSPTAVVGGGVAGPAPQESKGSGTAVDSGEDGGAGFGYEPYRGGGPPRIA